MADFPSTADPEGASPQTSVPVHETVSPQPIEPLAFRPSTTGVDIAGVRASAGCGCTCGGGSAGGAKSTAPQLVYALGTIGYDLLSESRRASLQTAAGDDVNLADQGQFASFIAQNPPYATSVHWTLNVDNTPIYAIQPVGPFAVNVYEKLREYLVTQLDEDGPDRVSIPGLIIGKATLLSSQVVPVVMPEIRGMFNWDTRSLVQSVLGAQPVDSTTSGAEHRARHRDGLENFLTRVYDEFRNLGVSPHDRALNYAATNLYNSVAAFADAAQNQMELESVEVTVSPICRPGQDCYDVKLYFFYTEKPGQTVRKVYRQTVDVSDVVPVAVGEVKRYSVR